MECPECGLPVLVAEGAITPHLRPDTLEPCDGKAHKTHATVPHEDHPQEPAKKAAAKAPAKAPAKASSKTARKS